MDRAAHIAAALLGLAVILAAAPLPAQDDVTIYRCTDAGGQVVIGNVPCADGARQDVRSMMRPVDGEPAPVPAAPPAPDPAPVPSVHYVVAQPPQPLYECVRPDGSVYESDSGDGEPRWVPLWTMGYPVGIGAGHRGRPGHGGRGDTGSRGQTQSAGSGLSAPPISRISIPSDPPRPDPGSVGNRPRPPHGGHGWPGGAGTWERDQCHVLPAAETCARMKDRRDDIRTRFFNAQQRERDTLRVEERGLNARIDRDCRTY
ncbi:DUF4124 domain-containing protein [Luteimonas terricola]|uniref:DUF4124 domain-containing protein n=1 Tax=Luteimonas terricola TaxID=645597 RepID=A0ABQ2E6Z5_9GAMM|nr:DUF4124 domain-containing protein [Luteimonas terricola]GGJ97326.1 hypothetical protein GCM10011394_02770 [Luteimonas terricola]